jgi:hypothetical protein
MIKSGCPFWLLPNDYNVYAAKPHWILDFGSCGSRGRPAKIENHESRIGIQLMSQHPSIRLGGSFEIRPTEELPSANALESNKRKEK